MQSNKKMIEAVKTVVAGPPVLLNTAGITAAVRASLKNYRKMQILIALTPASGTDAAAVTLKQSKSIADSPAVEKALSFTKMWRNVPATNDTWTETAVVSDTFNTSAAAVGEAFIIEVDETDLDIANGFDTVRANVADPGSVSTPAVVVYQMYGAKFEAAPADMLSATTD